VSNDSVVRLIQPGAFDDQLTEVLRNGAKALLAKAVEAEVADFLARHADLKTEDGHQRVVRQHSNIRNSVGVPPSAPRVANLALCHPGLDRWRLAGPPRDDADRTGLVGCSGTFEVNCDTGA
jgi:hypothetical protein